MSKVLATDIIKEIEILQTRMVELREQLGAYEGTNLDPVLLKFLVNHFEFNYGAEAKALKDDHEKARLELADLSVKVEHLSKELEAANLRRHILDAEITFHGPTLIKSEGSTVFFRCANCKTEFSMDVKGILSFQQLLNADTPEKMRFILGCGTNEFNAMCPKCHQNSKVIADRTVTET
jgi:Zn finger protein HypA/HybF involved in hydrogenase expression